MKGDKGNCQVIINGDLVLKTKFDTKENCQLRLKTLLKLGVAKANTKIYKCKECNLWHLGTPKQFKTYNVNEKN